MSSNGHPRAIPVYTAASKKLIMAQELLAKTKTNIEYLKKKSSIKNTEWRHTLVMINTVVNVGVNVGVN